MTSNRLADDSTTRLLAQVTAAGAAVLEQHLAAALEHAARAVECRRMERKH